jgi:surface protein
VCIHGKWSNTLANDSLSQSGKLIKNYFLKKKTLPSSSLMMNYAKGYAFWEDSVRTRITKISFVPNNGFKGSYDQVWDISIIAGSGDVKAYLKGTELYIVAQRGDVLAPPSNEYVFNGFSAMTSLSLSNYNTRYCTYTNALFANDSALTSINLSNYDTSNLKTFSSEFLNCSSLKEIDLRNSDMSKITYFENAFYNCNSLEKLYLPYLNTQSITNTERMFRNTGINGNGLTVVFSDPADQAALQSILP